MCVCVCVCKSDDLCVFTKNFCKRHFFGSVIILQFNLAKTLIHGRVDNETLSIQSGPAVSPT